jgi:hypothetical protein
MGESTAALLLVRYRAGVVGERARQCHLVPVPAGGGLPSSLVALCGAEFAPGEVELLPRPMGMPCELCLVLAAPSRTHVVERGSRLQLEGGSG